MAGGSEKSVERSEERMQIGSLVVVATPFVSFAIGAVRLVEYLRLRLVQHGNKKLTRHSVVRKDFGIVGRAEIVGRREFQGNKTTARRRLPRVEFLHRPERCPFGLEV